MNDIKMMMTMEGVVARVRSCHCMNLGSRGTVGCFADVYKCTKKKKKTWITFFFLSL